MKLYAHNPPGRGSLLFYDTPPTRTDRVLGFETALHTVTFSWGARNHAMVILQRPTSEGDPR